MFEKLIFVPPQPLSSDRTYITTDAGDVIYEFGTLDAEHILLYFHGNAVDVGRLAPHLEEYARIISCKVYAVEYPGYGVRHEEKLDLQATVESCHRAAEYVRGLGERLIVHGRSLGGAFAVQTAVALQAEGLILQSTFASAYEAVSPRLRRFPGNFLRNADTVARYGRPVLFIHGMCDDVIPIKPHLLRMLASVAKQPRVLTIAGRGHADIALNRNDVACEVIEYIYDMLHLNQEDE